MAANLRQTFNEDAEKYERYRPHYPAQLYDELIRKARLQPGAELLEIGPGTGQATRDLAARGYHITGVELGDHLAAKAREVLKKFPNVKIVTGAFEDAALPAHHFDLVFAATALHWVAPEVQFTKTAHILKDGGHLAIIHTVHVSDEAGDAFFKACHPIYKKYEDNGNTPHLPRTETLLPSYYDSELFDFVAFTPFRMAVNYSADDFAGLVSTYSATLALPPEKQAALLRDLKTLINEKFDGHITRHFAMTLTLLKKK